jgi:hypothetical protein
MSGARRDAGSAGRQVENGLQASLSAEAPQPRPAFGASDPLTRQKLNETPRLIFRGAPTLVDWRKNGEVMVPFQPV